MTVQIQPAFVVEPVYAPDAAERREPVRAEHLAAVRRRLEDGTLIAAGAYDDMSASLLIVATDDEQQALRVVHEDVYWREGVWTDVKIRRLNRVLPG